jgi:hypothetical protein
MESLRFTGVVVTAFIITFGAAFWLLMPRPLKPDARLPTWHRVDVDSPRYKMEQSSASDNDEVRDKLRHAVLEAAQDLLREPCNDAVKARYIAAATNYARAWLSIVPCFATRTCFGSSDAARLDRARDAFGSPLDHRVKEKMVRAHETGAIREGDFPKETAGLMALFANDPVINPQADPKIKQAELESRGPRVCRSYAE